VPTGNFDAGKSTIVTKIFGVQVKTGLDSEGRTAKISMHPYPDLDVSHMPLMIADCPGFAKEACRASNDTVRFLASLASDPTIWEAVFVLRVHRSGRQSTDDAALGQLLTRTKSITLVTHADARYEKRISDRIRQLSDDGLDDEADKIFDNKELRRDIAQRIVKEDEQFLGEEPYYVCCVGWGMPQEDQTSRDIIMCAQPRYPFVAQDFHEFFKVNTRRQVRERILGSLGYSGLQ
jgi:hypothetical protein